MDPTNDWNDAERRVERAQELFEQRKLQEALDELRAAADLNPYNAGWLFNIGLTLDAMGRFEEAADAYLRAAEIEPDDVPTLHRLAIDYHNLGRFDDALITYEKVEQIDPAFEPGYCGRILAYCDLGDHERAEEMFYLARLYKEHCPQCYYNIGVSLAARGLYPKAIYCWQKTLDTHGAGASAALPQVHMRIAEALRKLGDLEPARQHYLVGLRYDPGNTEALLDLSDLLMEMTRFDEAGEKIRRAVEGAPDSAAAHFALGRWQATRNHVEASVESFRRALEVDPTYPGAHLKLAELALRAGGVDTAKTHLRAELLLRPEDPGVLMPLANLFTDLGESRQALACLKRLTQIDPDSPAAWQNLAVAQFMRRRFEEGVFSSQRALELNPRAIQVSYNLALAYSHMRDYESALSVARAGLAIAPRDAAMQKLEFRVRVMRIKSHITSFVRRNLARVGLLRD